MTMRRQTPNLSKDFKKKENFGTGPPQLLNTEKLSQLKSKLEKDRQMVKTATGRRFKQTDARSSNSSFSRKQQPQTKTILSNEKSMRATPKAPTSLTKKPQTNTKAQTPARVSLSQLSAPTSQTASLTSSLAFFDKEKDIQKVRNKEVYDFLKGVHLQHFYDAFIQEGFDDLDTIMEIQTEVLNGMKMKASQQKRLLEQIRKAKGEVAIGTGTESKLQTSFSSINSRNRFKTQPVLQRPVTAKITNTSPKKQYKAASKVNSFLNFSNSSSFLYSVGNSSWSMEPATEVIRQRKACCRCLKITYQAVKSGYLFYCSNECAVADARPQKRTSPTKSKLSSDDTISRQAKTEVPARRSKQIEEDIDFIDLSMTASMIRDYNKQ